MISLDEDALICDFAEFYHILDYRSLPLRLAATLAAGLRESSRIKRLAVDAPCSQDTLLLATIADRVEMFRYGFSDNAQKGKNPPVSLVNLLLGKEEQNSKDFKVFNSAEEFDEALKRIRGE